jgi:5-methylcytosine-specific restriction protein A|tara:strand:- start:40 stop:414 length:375 start_codon:yes stop_codon:yes gene_type:complete
MQRRQKPCAVVACKTLTRTQYCEEHKLEERKRKAEFDKTRPTAHQRGYDSRWRKYRKIFLNKFPFCQYHLKNSEYVQATVVDHIIPHKMDKVLFWKESNHQALCKSCHDSKTAREDSRFGGRHE